jgi:phospholipid/cholesterol/gamma-HCH transport system permease protein
MEQNITIVLKENILNIGIRGNILLTSDYNFRIIKDLQKTKNDYSKILIDLKDIKKYDSYLPLIITEIEEFAKNSNKELEIICNNNEILQFLLIYKKKNISEEFTKEKVSPFIKYFTKIGNEIIILIKDGISFVEFIGDVTIKSLHLIIKPNDMRWADFPMHLSKSGVNAVPIVVLIVFLIGIITGYQGALQLKQFGADIFIADLVGISITRELGPLMTAILVAGRSGASFAAEIGTMKVSEEIDALNSMGFDHIKFLVLPRIMAVMFAMPLITIIADLFGILGGLITGLATLNITFIGFLNEMQRSLSFGDVFSGLVKSLIFGYLISTVGCFRGLQVKGGAESVGRYTTASVVTGVLLIIVTDAILIFVLQGLGI